MKRALLILVGLACHVGSVLAAPAPVESVQGYYEGEGPRSVADSKVEARCVALGDDKYRLILRLERGGKVEWAELAGATDKTTGDIPFKGKIGDVDCLVHYASGAIKGTVGSKDVLVVKRVRRTSPSQGKKAPEGAVVLIDGKNFANMKPNKGAWLPVDAKDGSIQVPKGGMNSVPKFSGSYDAHVEFRCPLEPKKRSQGRGNSGVYLPCGNEIQVLDSFGTGTYLGGGCGGLYRFKNPDTMGPIPSMKNDKEGIYNLASYPPLEWQTYDIEYRVKKDGEGKEKGFLTVYHNGVKIHDAVELKHKAGGFHFQDHSNPVRYRNIWVAER